MNIVDSSGWLEYFADGPNAAFFAAPIEKTSQLLVPSIIIYEVFKRVLQQRSEDDALACVAAMRKGRVLNLTESLALSAARTSVEFKMPMADSVIFATARACNAALWTQDEHFKGLEHVHLVEKI